MLCRATLPFNKLISQSRTITADSQENTIKSSNEWSPIYKFGYIKALSSFNRLKIYQIAVTTVVVPISFAVSEIVDPFVVASCGISGFITLSLASYAMRNTVGFIYTSTSQPDKVKFAYVTFWGNRKDVETEIENVIPFAELPRSIFDPFFITLRFYSELPQLKLIYREFGVINYKEFPRVFGKEQ